MSDHIRFVKSAPMLALGTAVLLAGCYRRAPEPPAQPATPVLEIVPPPTGGAAMPIPLTPVTTLPDAPEPTVDLELSNAPVRLVLQRLAEIGGIQLVIPPNLSRTISVQYVKVPVSVALKDVLSRSGLRLGTGPAANLPFDTVTVFYHLPANVDSMSADAIMRRFGVSRAIAELIVKSRRP